MGKNFDTFFEQVFNETLRFEGGIVNDKNDIGKLTYKGISKYFNPKWDGWELIDPVLVGYDLENKEHRTTINKKLSEDKNLEKRIMNFYFNSFWKGILDKIKYANLSSNLFDFSVNSGIGRSTRFLQEILAVKVDGDLGPATRAAIDAYVLKNSEMDLLIRLNLERCKFYLSRVELKPKQAAFLYGWLLRTITLHKKFYNLDLMDKEYIEQFNAANSIEITKSLKKLIEINGILEECKLNFNNKSTLQTTISNIIYER